MNDFQKLSPGVSLKSFYFFFNPAVSLCSHVVTFCCLVVSHAGRCVSVLILCLLFFFSLSHCRTFCCLSVVTVCIVVSLCSCFASFLSFPDQLSSVSFHSHVLPLFRACQSTFVSLYLCLIVDVMCLFVTRAGAGLILSPGVSCLRSAHFRSRPII